MMPCNPLQPSGPGAVERTPAAGGDAPLDAGFLSELTAQIEQETGAQVDPQALAEWLQEHNDDYPAIALEGLLPLLARLVNPSLAANPAALAASAGPGADPVALLERLIAASGGSLRAAGEAGGQAARTLLAALHAGDQAGSPEHAAAEPSAPAAFEHLLQSAAAVPGGPALAAADNRAGALSLAVATPVTQAGFGEAVGERLLWMVQHGVQHARLQLNPPGLGPLDITVSLHDAQLSITLNAQHALTREALAADASRLRGLLAAAGFAAVDVNVGHDQGRGDHPAPGAAPHGFVASDAAAEPLERVQGERPLRHGRSLVDHYA